MKSIVEGDHRIARSLNMPTHSSLLIDVLDVLDVS